MSDPITLGIAALILLVVLIAIRMPIAYAMILVGAGGIMWLNGPALLLSQLKTLAYGQFSVYDLSIVPMFILMGELATVAGLSQALFRGANAWLGWMRGGTAMAAIAGCAGFGAVCGSSLATASTMGKVALPELRRYNYSPALATGSLAAGGVLGILIPPSVVLIIFGLLTEADIGKLFLAGIIPGILGIVGYLLAVMVAVRLRPELAPKVGETHPMTRRDAVSVVAVLGLFVFIMAGIYGGFFTPIEAAGMGAAAALLIAFATGGLTRDALWSAFLDSATASAMIFVIIIGAEIFSNFVTFAGLPDSLSSMVEDLGLSPWAVLLLIVLIYMVLGCFLESLSMILLTVPVFYPVIADLDFGLEILSDPEAALIWFAIIVVVVTEISLITPPIGMNVFVLRSVLPDVPLGTIFRGVFAFWVADIVRLGLIIGLPVISLYLVA